ncbi:mitochondrial and peroxisomal fission factor mff domain-containing protein [Ditylenchus destructor]|uniref:Mitochondrial fission factor n=1 Tax=Ditylenchus destructor TaxID=166010 RepID=A0AAD4R1R4_9BILA|nr:mitochondrial and peroxisomal fission factor mff domain-containing protein [Ditylenchus destructor]
MMEVPDHIYIDGVKPSISTVQPPSMIVPEKIVVASDSISQSIATDRTSSVSANQYESPVRPCSKRRLSHEYTSQASVAVDENPLREIKNIRRQLARLSTRVMELEDENNGRKNRDTWIGTIGVIGGIIYAIFWFVNSQRRR